MAIQGMKVEEVDALAVSLREIARQRGIGLNDPQALALTVGMMEAASRSDAFRALLDLLSATGAIEDGQRKIDAGLRLVRDAETRKVEVVGAFAAGLRDLGLDEARVQQEVDGLVQRSAPA